MILVVAFGALVAAGIPLLLGMTAVIGALGLTAPSATSCTSTASINSVILLIGLAVGVDYSLFYLRREREERARGRRAADALQTAAATSGRAVLVSGFVVIIAMSGMFLMGSMTFASFGVGTVLVVAIALRRVADGAAGRAGQARRPRRPRPGPAARAAGARKDGESRFWGAIVGAVMRRPVVLGGAAAAAARRAGDPRLQPPHGQLRARRACRATCRHAGLRPHPEGVPRRTAARAVVVVSAPRRDRGRRSPPASPRSDARRWPAA